MNLIRKLLQATGLDKPLLNYKRYIDKARAERNERANQGKRLAFYRRFLNQGDLVFDIGANVGNRVQVFLEIGCRVVAVEPQPGCVRILNEKFGNRVTIEQVGLASREGQMEMFIADESTISTFSKEFIDKTRDSKFRRNNWNEKILVRIVRLDQLVQKYGVPLFCKIDVEGFETEVLRGLATPVPFLSFEYQVPEMKENVMNCLSLLNSLNTAYRFNYSIGESMTLVLPQHLPYEEFRNFVTSRAFLASEFGDIYAFSR
ncbi:MAG TPA: FkbM family methyltransferase [Flavisolibacter sp.]